MANGTTRFIRATYVCCKGYCFTSPYRWPLRVQTINAVNRPINFSRITNSRIIDDPPFCSAWRPGLPPGFLVLKLKCSEREPAHPRSTERLLMRSEEHTSELQS